jgi:predicted GIY-YIG superfamily endonuclease
MEHRDGDTKSTAGKNPKLVWSGTVQTRDEATRLEVELKRIYDKNPSELRRSVRDLQDLVEQLDFG